VLCELRFAAAIVLLVMRLTAGLRFVTCGLRLAACKPTGGTKEQKSTHRTLLSVFMQVE